MRDEFLEHVKEGLSKTPKKLSSRYFYDARGDALFREIMALDEYYLPDLEMGMIKEKGGHLAEVIASSHPALHVVELGSGDGSKTKFLLKTFDGSFDELDYTALDISENILKENKKAIEAFLPGVRAEGLAGNYFKTYPELSRTQKQKLVLYLGSNIGNFLVEEAVAFFKFVKGSLESQDYFLVTFDLVKDPRKIIRAYDDSEGVTREFNLNLLRRMNRELGANFEIDRFAHYPFYNPLNGITSSQIVSLKEQEIHFPDGFRVHFDAFEAIHTEVSKKYFLHEIGSLASQSGMQVVQLHTDPKREYALVLFQPGASQAPL